ncbi:alkaline phosphatase family protein [Rhodococcus triatomae]|uniref:Type I phosphodiesterase / nucleotide pyrophosphatase n=1 Tax=Rhodococcus triatomae TaxID=300028 RepID=A0A1G8GW42_9NOCA|nr:nucleotide pyrophosphatase/phosphodiesterase family protein [Rhodococcus triatomae]QNG20284.1 alkaline phosphatase family protein [Rhodococcus triatomae]QNG23801.1 alkaline phosphatase family protein [Rhodococcus triatomae]SDH98559.1 Type I phosphodiesterase / nucleotide pyrophosphatase [Rhodococcus triatomae]
MTAAVPPLDVHSRASLADVLPSVLSALGVPGEPGALSLPRRDRYVVLLVDGLGWNLLHRNLDHAPFLAGAEGGPIRAGFPTTTATSITTLGTGTPAGRHGVTGYRSWVPELDDQINWLSWHSVGGNRDLRTDFAPELAQPSATAFERASAAGVRCTTVLPASFHDSGLTRAALRGANFVGVHGHGDLLAHTVTAAGSSDRSLTYCYISEIDTLGHVYGPESLSWCHELRVADLFVSRLATTLPADTALLVTADHGMVTVSASDRIEFDDVPTLSQDVIALAGEPRCRHIHTAPGTADAVAHRWREHLGDRMWIGTRAEAIAAGMFGPTVTSVARERIGDVLAFARDRTAVVRHRSEPVLAELIGQHGALTDDELLVPLLLAHS